MPKQLTGFSVFARMKLKEIISIGLVVIAAGILVAWLTIKFPGQRAIPGVEGAWDCTSGLSAAASVCVKRVQPKQTNPHPNAPAPTNAGK